MTSSGIEYVEIGVSDLARSLDFYQCLLRLTPAESSPEPPRPEVQWLSAGPALVKLVHVGPGDLAGWKTDDLQRGLRHVGFKVGDVPRYSEHLGDAGVLFTIGPRPAVGDLWIAFFRDPDGTNLEITDGYVHYHEVFNPSLAERERLAAQARPPDARPRFDHIAVTAADLGATLALYRDTLGWPEIGRTADHQDPRGLRLHYLAAGDVVLEVFTFDAPTEAGPPPHTAETRLGLRQVGIRAMGDLTDPDGVPLRQVPGAGIDR